MKTPSVVSGIVLFAAGALVAAAGGVGIQLYRQATPSNRTGLPSTPKKGEKNYMIAVLVIGLLVGLAGLFILIMHFKKHSGAPGAAPSNYTSAGTAPAPAAPTTAQAQDFSLGEMPPSPGVPGEATPPGPPAPKVNIERVAENTIIT